MRFWRQRRAAGRAGRIYRGSLLMGGATWLLVAFLFVAGGFDHLELRSLDARFFWRGEREARADIVIVAVDEASFSALHLRWPWPRSIHAQLVAALQEAGAKVIGFDILFAEPSDVPGDDALLAQAIRRAGNVVLVNKVSSAGGRGHLSMQVSHPIEMLATAGARVGLANMQYDQDDFVRRSFVASEYNGTPRPSFPLAVVAQYAGLDENSIAAAVVAEHGRSATVAGHPFRLAADGTFLINYAGGAGAYPTYSYYQVLHGLLPPAWLKDKIVLVGVTDETLHDNFPTPYFQSGPSPGVEVHANAIATLLSGAPIRETGLWSGLALITVLLAFTSWLLARLGPWKGLALAGGEAVLCAGVSIYLFAAHDLWLPLVGPETAILGCYATVTAYRFVCEEGERRRIRSIFGRYVSDDVVKEMVDSRDEVVLGGKRQRVTVLFSDIRDFTPMSEKMRPEDVVMLLNEYFDAMTAVILATGGMIDKFVGDCIMALWGAPIPVADDAARAVRAAVLMRQALAQLQEKWRREGKAPFDTGVGINTAEVVVGNIGSQRRLDYTVIGDGVNLAARLESATKELGASVVISAETYALVQGQVIARPLAAFKVKGKEQPVHTYEVMGWREPDGRELLVPEGQAPAQVV